MVGVKSKLNNAKPCKREYKRKGCEKKSGCAAAGCKAHVPCTCAEIMIELKNKEIKKNS